MVGDVAADHAVDSARVYAAGLSAGAAMAVILGATYPDVFAAVGVHSGLEYAAATDATSALAAARSGGPDPTVQGDAAFAAMGSRARTVPVIVLHGDADDVVSVANGSQIATQWVETDSRTGAALSEAATTQGSGGGRGYTQNIYADVATGAPVVELYVVAGLGHAWSGGSSAGTFTDALGPDASSLFWQFFAAHAR